MDEEILMYCPECKDDVEVTIVDAWYNVHVRCKQCNRVLTMLKKGVIVPKDGCEL